MDYLWIGLFLWLLHSCSLYGGMMLAERQRIFAWDSEYFFLAFGWPFLFIFVFGGLWHLFWMLLPTRMAFKHLTGLDANPHHIKNKEKHYIWTELKLKFLRPLIFKAYLDEMPNEGKAICKDYRPFAIHAIKAWLHPNVEYRIKDYYALHALDRSAYEKEWREAG